MQDVRPKRGRPPGSTTFDPAIAVAFGAAIVGLRNERGLSQEALAGMAGIERAHMGRLERGEHLPNLAAIARIAAALACGWAELVDRAEQIHASNHAD